MPPIIMILSFGTCLKKKCGRVLAVLRSAKKLFTYSKKACSDFFSNKEGMHKKSIGDVDHKHANSECLVFHKQGT